MNKIALRNGQFEIKSDSNGRIISTKPVDDAAKELTKPDFADVLKQLAGPVGGGLVGYALASSLMGDSGEDRRKRSIWEKVLGQLIPLGIGGLGAYAGYRLSKNAQANGQYSTITTNSLPVLDGMYSPAVRRTGPFRYLAEAEEEARKKQIPVGKAYESMYNGWADPALYGGLPAGALAGGGSHLFAKYKANLAGERLADFDLANGQAIAEAAEARAAAQAARANLDHAAATSPSNGKVIDNLSRVEGQRAAASAEANRNAAPLIAKRTALERSRNRWMRWLNKYSPKLGFGLGAAGTGLSLWGLIRGMKNKRVLDEMDALTDEAYNHIPPR